MTKRVELKFKTDHLRADCEQRCQKVLSRVSLPDYRLLCGFDDECSHWFQASGFHDARGAHLLTQGSGLWPDFLEVHRYHDSAAAFHSLIYIPVLPPTDDPFVFVVTFAHELQHFVQCWTTPKIWIANNFLYEYLRILEPSIPAYETWRVPTERDAMVTSKQVAAHLFGERAIQSKVQSLISNDNAGKEWEYFQTLSSSATCNLLKDTDLLVKRYQPEILKLRGKWPPKVDFMKPEWWT